MNLTVGPHPPAVYWRRRAFVGAPLLLILILFASCMATGGSEQPSNKAARKPAAATATPSSAADCPREHPCETVVGVLPSPSPKGAANAPVAPPLLVDPQVSQPSSSPSPKSEICADADIKLIVKTDKVAYPIGALPRFTMTITNTSDQPCKRDVGPSHQELRVLSGGKRVWSSDDCAPKSGDDLRTLKPGEKRTYWLTWSGRTSVPGCPKTRTQVGPGTYELVGRLERIDSAPQSFTVKH